MRPEGRRTGWRDPTGQPLEVEFEPSNLIAKAPQLFQTRVVAFDAPPCLRGNHQRDDGQEQADELHREPS
jgi:hypothetical protein